MEQQQPKFSLDKYKQLLSLAIPSIGSMMVGQAQQFLDLYFIGLSKDVKIIGGVGLGNMLINLFGNQTFIGINGAIETLVPQSVSTKEYFMCGVLLNRGRWMILSCLLPIFILFTQMESILVYFGQDQGVAKNAERYIMVLMPKLILYGLFDCQRRWLNCFEYNHVPLQCQAVAVFLHYFWCQLFVVQLDLQIIGLGIANAITFSLALIAMFIYQSQLQDIQKSSCSLFDKRVFDTEGLRQYANVGFPNVLLLYMNFWIWELMILLSGLLSVNDQAANVIIMNIVSMFQMTSYGVGQAVSTLMGKQIGLQKVNEAHAIQVAAYQLATLLNLGLSTIMSICLPYLVSIFTQLDEVMTVVSSHEIKEDTSSLQLNSLLPCMPVIIAFNVFPDCLKNMQNGMIKSLGLMKMAIRISFVGNWIICLSLIYVFTFCKLSYLNFLFGLKGLWMAKLSGDIFICMGNYFLLRFDEKEWNQIAEVFQMKRKQQLEMIDQISDKGDDKYKPYTEDEETEVAKSD